MVQSKYSKRAGSSAALRSASSPSRSSSSLNPSRRPPSQFKPSKRDPSISKNKSAPRPKEPRRAGSPSTAPLWMQKAVVAAFSALTHDQCLETLAILHIALDWSAQVDQNGLLSFGRLQLPSYLVQRLYRCLVLPTRRREDVSGASSDAEQAVEQDPAVLAAYRQELTRMIPWLDLETLVQFVRIVEEEMPQQAAGRHAEGEAAAEVYDMDVDQFPPALVCMLHGLVEPVVQGILREEYRALLAGEAAVVEERGCNTRARRRATRLP